MHFCNVKTDKILFRVIVNLNGVKQGIDNFLVYFKTNFVDSKFGWCEGYQSGDPSQFNGIESSHKVLNNLRILKKGCRLVEEWSKLTHKDKTVGKSYKISV